MAGFRKAKAEQAALKVGTYGPPGSGKTLTTLLMAEGLAKLTKKRVAYVDTERGTDFYCQSVNERAVHPDAFDFDAIYTRSITEVSREIHNLDPNVYGIVVLDSITHLWEAARNAYAGKETSIGTIPFHAWAKIKKPYKDLVAFLLSSPMHVFFCGRQGNEFEQDEDGEMKKVGVKMKAEGETAYEPHILFRMEPQRLADGKFKYTIFAEKDRTGILSGKVIENPNFDNVIKPLLKVLGAKQAQIETDDATGVRDAENISAADEERERNSGVTLTEFKARFDLCRTKDEVAAVAKEITAELKKAMLPAHVAELREKYLETERKFK